MSDSIKTSQIVTTAIGKWEELTGMKMDTRSFSYGELDVSDMNRVLRKSIELDPEGVTAYLLLECFLRRYLEAKTFTAAEIMKDYAANTAYLKKAEDLFSIVQSEHATALASEFRSRVLDGTARYGCDRDDVTEMVNNPDILPFLRRDALHSIENLEPFQFLTGDYDEMPAKVVEHVYIAWDINELLRSVRDMRHSGIAVVLLRDPSHADRSFFVFAMRNGGNVTLLTDKSRPVYPGQEDVLSGRGGRGASRTFEARKFSNHFPYHLIKTHICDDTGDTVFEKETQPVIGGKSMAPLMRISDLEPHQVIWLTMMLSLVSEKFWKRKWQATSLSYTGAMVTQKALLVTDGDQNPLPAALGYQPLPLEDVTLEDISYDNITEAFGLASEKRVRVNQWLEDRYAASVNPAVLNVWQHDRSTVTLLAAEPDATGPNRGRQIVTPDENGLISVPSGDRLPSWEAPRGRKLGSFSPFAFGTTQQLREDRLYTARRNLAEHIEREATIEFNARKGEVAAWYKAALMKNLPFLLKLAVDAQRDPIQYRHTKTRVLVGNTKTEADKFQYENRFHAARLSELSSGKWLCIVNGSASTYRVNFYPRTAADIALLTDLDICDLPDVLQNWLPEQPYTGNHLLDRLDPVETVLHDPWHRFETQAELYLSKSGLNKISKTYGTSS